jgi:beta-phosphoglucomutase family hydrolase
VTVVDALPLTALGLPRQVRACLFDLDGVLTRTAAAHARAWKETFDELLRKHAGRTGTRFVPFGLESDYREYVDGKARAEGVRSFLASRGIVLPEGGPDDPAAADTVHGLANRKNERLLTRLESEGIGAYEGSRTYVLAARRSGLRTAVVSASANCREVLAAAGMDALFDARIDGLMAARDGLRGKPAPDTYLAAARALDVLPEEAAVFEDALAGVAAARSGGFAFVVGVDRTGRSQALREAGADVVVHDLRELLELR